MSFRFCDCHCRWLPDWLHKWFFIVKYKFNSLIVTLGTSSICSGILFGTFEAGRTELPEKLYALSKINLVTVTNAKSGLSSSLPFTFVIMIVLYLIAYFILNYTMAGRSVYAVGGDEVSAERAGINVGKVRFLVFVVNGGIAAIAGLCYAMMSYFICRMNMPERKCWLSQQLFLAEHV